MSSTNTPPPTTPTEVARATDVAIRLAKDAPALVAELQTANPALYAQLLGSGATYSKSAVAPIIGSALGWIAAHYGFACTTAITTACWSQETIDLATYACVALGTAVGAAVMHWIGKSPARAVVNSTGAQS